MWMTSRWQVCSLISRPRSDSTARFSAVTKAAVHAAAAAEAEAPSAVAVGEEEHAATGEPLRSPPRAVTPAGTLLPLLFERLDALNGVPNDEDTVALPLSKKTNSKVDEVTVKTLMVKYCSVKRSVAWDAGGCCNLHK